MSELRVPSRDLLSTSCGESGEAIPGSPIFHSFCFSFLTFHPSRFFPLNGSIGFGSAAEEHDRSASETAKAESSRRNMVSLERKANGRREPAGVVGTDARVMLHARGANGERRHRVPIFSNTLPPLPGAAACS